MVNLIIGAAIMFLGIVTGYGLGSNNNSSHITQNVTPKDDYTFKSTDKD